MMKEMTKMNHSFIYNTLIYPQNGLNSSLAGIEETPFSALQTVSVNFLIIANSEGVYLVLKHTGSSIVISPHKIES